MALCVMGVLETGCGPACLSRIAAGFETRLFPAAVEARLPQGQCGPGGARPGQPAPGAGRAGGHRPLRCALAASGAGDRLGPASRARGLRRRQCGAAGPPGRAQRPRHQAGLARGGAGAAPGDRARRGDAAPARGGHRPGHAGDAHRPAGADGRCWRWPAPRPLPSAAAGSAASPASSASWSRAGSWGWAPGWCWSAS